VDGIDELVHHPNYPEAYLFESVATRQVLNGLVVEAEYAFRVGACLHCGTRKEDSELKEAGFDDIRAVGWLRKISARISLSIRFASVRCPLRTAERSSLSCWGE